MHNELFMMDKIQSDVIQMMRFPLIFLVVFVHMIPTAQQSIHWDGTEQEIYTIIVEMISHHIGRIAVPFFFLFSGYFFFFKITRWTTKSYTEQLKKRMPTLLIPYILWNVIFIVVIFLKNIIFKHVGFAVDDNYILLSERTFYDLIWKRPINFPLWYLRDLIVMVLLTPLFFYFFKYLRIYGLLLLMVGYLLNIEIDIPGFSTTAFFYFGAGSCFALMKKNMLEYAQDFGKFSVFLGIVMLGITTYYTNTRLNEYLVRVFVIFTIPALFFLFGRLQTVTNLSAILIKLSGTVFFIYALHMIYILNWLKGGFYKTSLGSNTLGLLSGYFFIPSICVLIALIFFYILQHYMPKTLSLLTGNRVNKL